MNKNIKKYTTASGKTRYMFRLYIGKNELTGESDTIQKRGFKTEKEALESYLDYQLKVVKGEYVPKSKRHLIFNDVFNMWKKVYRNKVKESTYATTLRYFDGHIIPVLGSKYFDKITVLDCQNAVNTWYTDTPHTFKRFIRYASNVFNYGINLDLISKNPMSKVIRPKQEEKPDNFTDFYSKEELNEFLQCAKKYSFKSFIFFRLLAYLGLRKGEALALRWSDVDFKANTISISRDLTTGVNNRLYESSTPKTKSSIKALDVDRATMNYLKEWRLILQKDMFKLGYNFLDSNNLLFPTINNGLTSLSKPTQWNNAICKKYGLRHIKVHGFRHTHATLLIESGADIKEVQQRMRHSDIKTTMNVYAHVTKNREEKTATNFAKFMES